MTHTKGPWMHANTAGNHQFAIYPEATGKDIALVYNRCQESEANARLIASAPELLEALQEVIRNYENRLPIGFINRISQTINKATGQ